MLQDTASEPQAGHHVEQLEIVFSRRLDSGCIDAAWRKTLASCEVLRTAFDQTDHGKWFQIPAAAWPEVEIHPPSLLPAANDLADDRLRPLPGFGQVPFRFIFWPGSRRGLWTFHHAMLDGRSITRLLEVFLTHLAGAPCDDLPLSVWHPPSPDAVAIATEAFRRIRRECPNPLWPHDRSLDPGQAVRRLGGAALEGLETRAAALKVTAATVVTWAWGQALAGFLGRDAVLVEQVRAGGARSAAAGFTMHVLPLMIRRSSAAALPAFRANLLSMRAFETVSPDDFPTGIFPDTADAPVIMVEHSTISHALRGHSLLESATLHEREASFPSASAFLRPDLKLKVEGPHARSLLARWCAILEFPDF